MNLDKRTIAGVSGILVFSMVIGLSSATADGYVAVDKDIFGIESSAGANAAINGSGDKNVAGATGAVDGTIGVVDTDKDTVGQGVQESTNTETDTDANTSTESIPEEEAPVYESFGYTNLGMAVVKSNLNVREEANKTGSVVGKMTNYAACEILGEENGFYKIKSGNVEGYVSAEYIVTGEEALILANQEVRNIAKVTTKSLRVRESATTDSNILSTVNKGEELVVTEVINGWVKVEIDDVEGYVSADYVDVAQKLKTANTLSELRYGAGVSNVRVDLVNYALQFVGNRYVWGGTSLTKGVDCSGFTMKIYQKYGISLPHYSGSQPSYGKKITRSQLQPGDLIFYGEGGKIDHVAIYIGNGQIVHAANKRDGIKISNAFYKTPICYRSYL